MTKAAIPHVCSKNMRPKIIYTGKRCQKQFQRCFPLGNVVLNMNLPQVALIRDSASGIALRELGGEVTEGEGHTFFKE